MKFHYYPETDSLYIDLRDAAGSDTRELGPGIRGDYDAQGRLVGIDIDHASQCVDLSRIEAIALPVQGLVVSPSASGFFQPMRRA